MVSGQDKFTSRVGAEKAGPATNLFPLHLHDPWHCPEDFQSWSEVGDYMESFLKHPASIIELIARLLPGGARESAARYLRQLFKVIRRTESLTIWASQRVMAEAIGRSLRGTQLGQAALESVGLIVVAEQEVMLILDCLLALDEIADEETALAVDQVLRDEAILAPNTSAPPPGISTTSTRVVKDEAMTSSLLHGEEPGAGLAGPCQEVSSEAPGSDIDYSNLPDSTHGFGPDPTRDQIFKRQVQFQQDRKTYRKVQHHRENIELAQEYRQFIAKESA